MQVQDPGPQPLQLALLPSWNAVWDHLAGKIEERPCGGGRRYPSRWSANQLPGCEGGYLGTSRPDKSWS